MKITLEMIKELRTKTGAGVSVVKEALSKYEGDMDKSLIYLREKGLAKAEKRADKSASNGLVTSYIHGNGSLGVLLELHSETDFAAKGEKFAESRFENIAKRQVTILDCCRAKSQTLSESINEVRMFKAGGIIGTRERLSLIHISEPTRPY